MRVERLDLIAYGHYAETTLDLSAPERGLTLIFGANEAGKSTARRALIASLFGFERNQPDAYHYGRHGLRVGVRLSAADGTELSFERQGMSRIVGEDGAPLGEGVVETFCSGLQRDIYLRLFSVDHDELRTGSESLIDADGEIGRLVYGASLGSGSIAEVLNRLERRAAALFQERGRAQMIPKALDAYRVGMRGAKDARVRSKEWDKLHRAVEDSMMLLGSVRGEFEAARDEQERLQRIRSARPLLARRTQVSGQLVALGSVAGENWARRASKALNVYRRRRSEHDGAVATRNRLADQVEAIDVPSTLLERAGRIDKLVEGIGRYKKDSADLPKRRAELDGAVDRCAQQLRVLGKSADDGRIIAEAELVAVEMLVRRHVELIAQGETASEELRKAREKVSAAKSRLARLPEPSDVAALERVLRLARPKLEVARDLEGRMIEQDAADVELTARAGRLGLGALSRDDVEALAVPFPAEIDAERDRRESLRLQLAQIAVDRDRIGAVKRSAEEEIANLGVDVPDPGRLDATREYRDIGWGFVRRKLEGLDVDADWSKEMPLPDAYEAAVSDADGAADDRYDHADGVARLAQLRSRTAELEQQSHEVDEREQALTADDNVAFRRWAERWTATGVEARPPEEMVAWLRDQQALVADIVGWRQHGVKCDSDRHEVERQVAALDVALAESAHEPCSKELDFLVAQAEEVVEEALRVVRARSGVETELRLAEEAEPQRTAAIEQHEYDLESFRGEWVIAVQPLLLDPAADPANAAVAVTAHRALAAAREEVASLERRIEGIEEDRGAFTYEAAGAASAVMELADDATPLDVVPELQRRLAAARSSIGRREVLANELETANSSVESATTDLQDARRELIALRSEVAMEPTDDEPDSGMDASADRAIEAASLREKLTEIESDLLEQGGGMNIDQIVVESSVAGDSLGGKIDALATDVRSHSERLEEATSNLTDARRALERVNDAATAADLEQDAQAELALASELATDYSRTVLAAEVLRRTIAEYGERHRGPLLDRAAELFRLLTEGAFSELVPDSDGDRQVLLAKRRGGEPCTAAALSDGTRDQLYLALRLAGIEHQLGVISEPPPIVLDDILVHFDDPRAAAAMRALGELGRFAQVLLFTHHERIVEIARHELDDDAVSVVRLDPRDHDQLPLASVGTRTSDGGRANSRNSERMVAENQILAAARNAGGQPLSKSRLLELSGIPESIWSTAIRSLVERGDLLKEGEKKGARYRPALGR